MNVKEITLNKALTLLRAVGAQYIVKTEDGTEHVHGDLKLAPSEPEKLKRKRRVPVGTYHAIYNPLVKDMKVGDEVLVPFNGYNPEHIQSAVTAHLSHVWGKGTYATHMAADGLQVLRVS